MGWQVMIDPRGMLSQKWLRPAAALVLSALVVGACATTARETTGLKLPPYHGPKAKLAVARFEDKTAKGRGEIGSGMAEMLTTELVNSGRYVVLERGELADVLDEQDLGAGGRVQSGTAPPIGEVTGADVLVMGAVTSFEPDRLGVGGTILGVSTIVGSAILHIKNENIPIVAAGYKESSLELDLRLVDAASGEVIAAVSAEGKAVDMGGGVLAEVGGGRSRMPLAFGGWQKKSVEEAVREAIGNAVLEIIDALPRRYYRHAAEAIGEGELVGFAYLDIAPGKPPSTTRDARALTGPAELTAVAGSWGLDQDTLPGALNFNEEMVVAVVGGPADRGRSLSVRKIVNEADALRIEIAVLPVPAGISSEESSRAPIPHLLVRAANTGKPLRAVWLE